MGFTMLNLRSGASRVIDLVPVDRSRVVLLFCSRSFWSSALLHGVIWSRTGTMLM